MRNEEDFGVLWAKDLGTKILMGYGIWPQMLYGLWDFNMSKNFMGYGILWLQILIFHYSIVRINDS